MICQRKSSFPDLRIYVGHEGTSEPYFLLHLILYYFERQYCPNPYTQALGARLIFYIFHSWAPNYVWLTRKLISCFWDASFFPPQKKWVISIVTRQIVVKYCTVKWIFKIEPLVVVLYLPFSSWAECYKQRVTGHVILSVLSCRSKNLLVGAITEKKIASPNLRNDMVIILINKTKVKHFPWKICLKRRVYCKMENNYFRRLLRHRMWIKTLLLRKESTTTVTLRFCWNFQEFKFTSLYDA